MKTCKKCGTSFDGRYCVVCDNARSRKRYANNKEAALKYCKEYYETNREKCSATRKKYYEANREKIIAGMKTYAVSHKDANKKAVAKYRENNAERVKENAKAWRDRNKPLVAAMGIEYRESNKAYLSEKGRLYRENNKEKFRVWIHSRRVRCVGVLSLDIAERLFSEQGGRCACCGLELTTFHLDHKVPLSRGGVNEDHNVQLLTPTCNLRKGSKTMEEYLEFKKLRTKKE